MACFFGYHWGIYNEDFHLYDIGRVWVFEDIFWAGDSWHSSKIIRADEKNTGII
jgi:hypothetical protein